MSEPVIRFLEEPAPLARQVAEVLLEGSSTAPADLRGTQVWVPTAGAARRIRHALAETADELGTGVLPPDFVQPMQALVGEDPERVPATRSEREGAWARVLADAPRERIDALFPQAESLRDEPARLASGSMLCDVCDLLAEAGRDPLDPALARVCAEDATRWEQWRPLYRDYLAFLEAAGRWDPNVLRLRQLASPALRAGLRRVVIAVVPDLPRAAELFAQELLGRGVGVSVLVWKPAGLAGEFDAWGRPLPEEWGGRELPLIGGQIVVARDPADEARAALDFASGNAGDYAIILADPGLEAAFASETLRRGRTPFFPAGDSLAVSEAAAVAVGWLEWQEDRELRTLRRLVECPGFARWLAGEARVAPDRLLSACDFLTAVVLAETLGQARDYLRGSAGEEASPMQVAAARIMEALDGTREPGEILRLVWGPGGAGAEEARQVLELWDGILSSPVFQDWPEGRAPAFLRALKSAAAFRVSQPGEVEMSGWLEAPWSPAGRLALCGCVEGCLPTAVTEHPFLPDSKRAPLGLADNAARRARDAYLLSALALVRPAGDFRCSFSKRAADGTPALPSGLLFQGPDEELPGRVLRLFSEPPVPGGSVRRANAWRWRLPDDLRIPTVEKISPTDFKEYLSCPFRFYFSRILHLEAFDPRAREMDALRFGTLVHKALENFALETPEAGDEAKIARLVLAHLDAAVRRAFGPSPGPAVRIQIEAARVRLLAFARVQAAEFAAGWRILDVERKLSAGDPEPLKIGPLALSAKIDRIEEHPKHGLRIVDYKTYGTTKTPAKTHFGPALEDPVVPESAVEVDGKLRSWQDLQLPLYHLIAGKFYPGRPVRTAYFILPADPSLAAVESLELSDSQFASALACAEAVAARVARRNFWPPQPVRGPWEDPFAPLFLNGRAEDCIDAETIEFLKGEAR